MRASFFAAGTLAVTTLFFATRASSQDPRAEASATVQRNCVGCHSAALRTAGLVLDPAGLVQVGSNAEVWEKVLPQLRAGTMPPAGSPRPEAGVYTRMAGYLTQEFATTARAHPNPGELSPIHRLTRTEYRTSISDLLVWKISQKRWTT